jgi:hypothetical protein
LEVSWCSADGPASGIERSVSSAHGLAFIAGLSAVRVESYTVVVLFSAFVAVCFSSTAFGFHLFCGGGYCGCVSLNIFSASFSWFSFALRRCNFRFCDRVNPDGHHRGMEYFGSVVLLIVVSSFLLVLADSPIIGPSTSVVPILMTPPFIILLEAVAVCPCWINRSLHPSGPTILLGPCSWTRLRGSCWNLLSAASGPTRVNNGDNRVTRTGAIALLI